MHREKKTFTVYSVATSFEHSYRLQLIGKKIGRRVTDFHGCMVIGGRFVGKIRAEVEHCKLVELTIKANFIIIRSV